MTWQILIPLLIVAWGIAWFVKSRSLAMALTVVARISLLLGSVYLITQAIWGLMVPQGVCPLTTSLPMMLTSISIPVIVLGIMFYLATYVPQLVETDSGIGLLAGEDVFLREPIEIKQLKKNQYLITTQDKEHKLTLRGRLAKSVIKKISQVK